MGSCLRETRVMMSRPSSVRLTFYIFIIYVIPSHVDSLVVLSLLP